MNFESRSNSSYSKGQVFQERSDINVDVVLSQHVSTGIDGGDVETRDSRQASPEQNWALIRAGGPQALRGSETVHVLPGSRGL